MEWQLTSFEPSSLSFGTFASVELPFSRAINAIKVKYIFLWYFSSVKYIFLFLYWLVRSAKINQQNLSKNISNKAALSKPQQ